VAGDFDDRAAAIARSTGDRITLHGFVDDYVPIARNCNVALLPVVEGTGVNTKVLDAMALGIPVITTRLGIKGIAVEHEREVLIADTPLEMHRMIARLAEDSTLGARLSEAARAYILSYHDPLRLHEQFREYVAKAIECGRARLIERARLSERSAERAAAFPDVMLAPRAQEASIDRSAT
jgi:glycosyltransferase involved in cell wall biosynthesis